MVSFDIDIRLVFPLKSYSFSILFIFHFLLDIRISLEHICVVFISISEKFNLRSFSFLLLEVHFFTMLKDQLGLSCNHLSSSFVYVLHSFFLFEFGAGLLYFICLVIFLLFCQILLNLNPIQQFWAVFELKWLIHFSLSHCFKLHDMFILILLVYLLISLLSLKQNVIPLLVEILILFDMSVFSMITVFILSLNEFIPSSVVILSFKLCNPIIGYLCFNVSSIFDTVSTVVL